MGSIFSSKNKLNENNIETPTNSLSARKNRHPPPKNNPRVSERTATRRRLYSKYFGFSGGKRQTRKNRHMQTN
jgi:hypothetical protein